MQTRRGLSVKLFKVWIERTVEVVFEHEVGAVVGIHVEDQAGKMQQLQLGKRNQTVVLDVFPHAVKHFP
jgi:hypothetical protein